MNRILKAINKVISNELAVAALMMFSRSEMLV